MIDHGIDLCPMDPHTLGEGDVFNLFRWVWRVQAYCFLRSSTAQHELWLGQIRKSGYLFEKVCGF